MIYVTSDLHGLEITKLKALLKKACFNENDRLFVLGDVIDRQNDGGVAILIWLSEQPNTQLILGNHEAMLYPVILYLTKLRRKVSSILIMSKRNF